MEKQDDLRKAMLWDAVTRRDQRNYSCFVGFLDEREQFLTRNLMEQAGIENYMLWGGYDGAERVVFGALSAYGDENAFPIVPITFTYRKQDRLSHRDFLGALMALGIERDTLGDLLIEEGRRVAFVRQEMAPYILSQVEKIGSVGVRLTEGVEQPYPAAHRVVPISAVVSSLRVDCIVAACTGFSREKTKTTIAAGLVTVNYQECRSPSMVLSVGDKLSIRGKGKFCLAEVGGQTRKGRTGVVLNQYL